jgi:poly-gamma-glutamate synthesis protein (capsule biosynthesis protein)
VLEVGGLRFAVTAHDLTRGVPPSLESDLKAARGRGDVLVATFHVTGPALYLPRPELRRAVELALAAGARVVAAHGTHAVGPVERRGGAVIAWGLGNVAFACDCTDEPDALLLRVRFEGENPAEAVLLPIDAGLNGGPARPSMDAAGVLQLLESIGSSPLRRDGPRGRL